MKRREFLAASCAAGLTAVSATAAAAGGQKQKRGANRTTGRRTGALGRDIYELRQYHCDSPDQQKRLDDFLCKAMLPALNRAGIDKVGVFHEREASDSPTVYVLIRHKTGRSVFTLTGRLLKDTKFLADGKDFLDGGSDKPGYSRIESGLLLAFEGIRRMEIPSKKDTRVFQLRIYESPSVKTGQKKIEMFNVAEIDIFRRTGLNPVFFGESITGAKLPNLTYMLGFDNEEAQKSAWQKFIKHPDWIALKSRPEYADKKILCGITNILLKPAPYSQI